MANEQPRDRPRLAVIGFRLSVAAFVGELAILAGWAAQWYYTIHMIVVFGLPLMWMHLAGTFCGAIALWRAPRLQTKSKLALAAIGTGLFGLMLTAAVALYLLSFTINAGN